MLLLVATQAWFQEINDKKHVFIKYDIKDYFSSISEHEPLATLNFANVFINVTPDQVEIILYCK